MSLRFSNPLHTSLYAKYYEGLIDWEGTILHSNDVATAGSAPKPPATHKTSPSTAPSPIVPPSPHPSLPPYPVTLPLIRSTHAFLDDLLLSFAIRVAGRLTACATLDCTASGTSFLTCASAIAHRWVISTTERLLRLLLQRSLGPNLDDGVAAPTAGRGKAAAAAPKAAASSTPRLLPVNTWSPTSSAGRSLGLNKTEAAARMAIMLGLDKPTKRQQAALEDARTRAMSLIMAHAISSVALASHCRFQRNGGPGLPLHYFLSVIDKADVAEREALVEVRDALLYSVQQGPLVFLDIFDRLKAQSGVKGEREMLVGLLRCLGLDQETVELARMLRTGVKNPWYDVPLLLLLKVFFGFCSGRQRAISSSRPGSRTAGGSAVGNGSAVGDIDDEDVDGDDDVGDDYDGDDGDGDDDDDLPWGDSEVDDDEDDGRRVRRVLDFAEAKSLSPKGRTGGIGRATVATARRPIIPMEESFMFVGAQVPRFQVLPDASGTSAVLRVGSWNLNMVSTARGGFRGGMPESLVKVYTSAFWAAFTNNRLDVLFLQEVSLSLYRTLVKSIPADFLKVSVRRRVGPSFGGAEYHCVVYKRHFVSVDLADGLNDEGPEESSLARTVRVSNWRLAARFSDSVVRVSSVHLKASDQQRALAELRTVCQGNSIAPDVVIGDFNLSVAEKWGDTDKSFRPLLPNFHPTTIGSTGVSCCDNVLVSAAWQRRAANATVCPFEQMRSAEWYGTHGNWLSDHFMILFDLMVEWPGDSDTLATNE